MDSIFVWILGATIVTSLISLIGIFTLLLKDRFLEKILLVLIGLSAGALLGGAFLHLIPEAVKNISIELVSTWVIIGFGLFFLIERLLHWHHCHKGDCDAHRLHKMNLVGDGVHNLIDGAIIAISFLVNVPFGIITTLAIIAHEVPQEISDFGVLVYGGFSKMKALFYNFVSATLAIVGALLGFFLSSTVSGLIPYILSFAAGGFIYIAATDLVPEMHKESDFKKTLWSFILFIVGILLMVGIKVLFGG